MTLKELLNKDPEPKDVMLRHGAEYLPIGIVETYLDEVNVEWDTENFKYQFHNVAGSIFLSGDIELIVSISESGIYNNKRMVGSCSMEINEKDENTNYLATLESYCIANAAKRMGRRFGRHLNNRMLGSEESGNTIPEIQVDKTEEPTDLTSYTKNLNLPNV